MNLKVAALMKGGRIYTLTAYKEIGPDFQLRPHPHFRWKGYCDGQPCGLFRTKREFEFFVECEPESPPFDEDCVPAMRAETWSTWEGNQILHKIIDSIKKQKRDNDGEHLQTDAN